MGERRKIGPFNQAPRHGSSQRGVRPTPRRTRTWDESRAQAEDDKRALLDHMKLEEIKRRYNVFGNKNLPAIHEKASIISMVGQNKASIIEGDTGSGKSTQGLQFLYEAGYHVISLVPRKIIADGLHDRVVEEMAEHLGLEEATKAVGVQHGDRTEVHDENRIQIMTPNTFIRMEADLREKYRDEKVVIISDEIHEANLYTELATGVAAQAVDQLDSWRLVAMSATQNKASLEKSFSSINGGGEVPSVAIEGRPFAVKIHERPEDSVYETYASFGEQHEKAMIFTSGKNEIQHIIDETIKTLEDVEPGSSAKVEFRVLHGDLSPTERRHINDPVPEGKRLVIVSSPAGMSGITIPGVTCVISDGTINRSEIDEDEVSGLTRRYLSQAEVIQQMGRAGRDVDGGVGYVVKPTVIHEDYLREQGRDIEAASMPFKSMKERDPFGPPEIYNSQLGQSALAIAALDRSFYDINEYLPHPVERSGIISAQQGLHRMGAMAPHEGNEDFVISDIGREMSKFSMRPELSRGIVEAQRQKRSALQMARVAYMAAALEAGGVQDFSKDSGDAWKKLVSETADDDWMAQYDILMSLPSHDDKNIDEKFLAQHDLHYRRTQRALEVARKALKVIGIRRENLVMTPPNQVEKTEILRDMTAGMTDFVYEKTHMFNKRMRYRNIHGGPGSTERYISDRSVTSQHEHEYVMGFPRWFMRQRSRVKQDIVELLAPVDTAVVGYFARKHDVYDRVPAAPRMDGSVVKDYYQPVFGSLRIGAPEIGSVGDEISPVAQELLVERALNHQRRTQVALREVASELNWLTRAIPAHTLELYKKPNSGGWLTHANIDAQVRRYAKVTNSEHELDRKLGEYLYHAKVGIDRYFTEESYEYLKSLAPHEKTASDGSVFAVQYATPDQPYVIMTRTEHRDLLKHTDMRLPDGREILVKVQSPDEQISYISASQL